MSDFFDDVFTAYCNSYNECASCPLGKETGDCRDLFAKRVKEWEKAQVEMAAVEITPSTAADKDVGGKWPKWVKEGAWVAASSDITGESFLGEIVEVCKEAFHVRLCEKEFVFSYGPEETCYVAPVYFAPYNYKEAKGLLGKVMEYEIGLNNKHKCCVMINSVCEDGVGVCINWSSYDYWTSHNATINGVPIGVPEVDEDALKEG